MRYGEKVFSKEKKLSKELDDPVYSDAFYPHLSCKWANPYSETQLLYGAVKEKLTKSLLIRRRGKKSQYLVQQLGPKPSAPSLASTTSEVS